MTVRRKRTKDLAVYFCTFTCWQWLNLFKEANAYDAVYAWMDVATAKGFRFLGYVIMPNHAHFVIYVPQGKVINALIDEPVTFVKESDPEDREPHGVILAVITRFEEQKVINAVRKIDPKAYIVITTAHEALGKVTENSLYANR